MEKRLLQLAILIGGIVPVSAGIEGALLGTRLLGDYPGRGADSHFRYMSGLLLGIGLIMWGCIPTIERRATIVRTITAIVVLGGLARLYGWIAVGDPGKIRWALVMELVVTPLICLWQTRIARYGKKI
jgi:hypothetical protein